MNDRKIQENKREFMKRYKYICENAFFILSPYMHEETSEEVKRRVENSTSETVSKEPTIYLKSMDTDLLVLLEEFLFGTTCAEESILFKKIQMFYFDDEYLEEVKTGSLLLEKLNEKAFMECLKTKLDFWQLLTIVRGYISCQTGDLKNKQRKLEVLDEYFRTNRYSNDGKVWTSGFQFSFKDFDNYDVHWDPFVRLTIPFTLQRDKTDVGVKNNPFISCFSNTAIGKYKNNSTHLTENEKQEVYLYLHEQLQSQTGMVGEVKYETSQGYQKRLSK